MTPIEKAKLRLEQYLDAGDSNRSSKAYVEELEHFIKAVAHEVCEECRRERESHSVEVAGDGG